MLLGVLLVLFGYALGSIPTGFLVGWAWGIDVRRVGSGNIGTANVLRAAGKWPAIVTMLGDMLKGLVPVVVARLLTENGWGGAAGGAGGGGGGHRGGFFLFCGGGGG